jgi:hypothetical protein
MLKVIILFLALTQSVQAKNQVLCWIFKMQGCPGVEVKQGRAINMFNSGRGGVGAIGGKTDQVEKRWILNIPDYKIRRIKRFFGLGGNRINVSFSDNSCQQSSDTLPGLETTLLRSDFKTCFKALEREVDNYPNGIDLDIIQCQHYFCEESFLIRFEEFLKTKDITAPSTEKFLRCPNPTVEV